MKTNHNNYLEKHRRTKRGILSQIYDNQVGTSKRRNHSLPSYSRKELYEWAIKLEHFNKIYTEWVKSGYEKDLVPSIDRIDDYKGYSFDNIQLTWWKKNRDRGHNDRRNGINNKQNNTVVKKDIHGNIIEEFHSRNHAIRVTGIVKIGDVCNGKRKTAGGFIWEYKTRRYK